MKLIYRDLPATTSGRPAVALHDRGAASVERIAGLAQASGAVARVLAPYGDYGFTASGMELAGICWYRTVPGFTGPDPLTLARAVVQVGDLLDDLDLDRPALLGCGQGAVVALGAGLLQADRVASVVAIDAASAHVEALPASLMTPATPLPVLLMSTVDDGVTANVGTLAAYGIAATGWHWPGGADEDRDKATAERIGRWLDDD